MERARERSVGIAFTAWRKPSWVPVLSTPVPLTLLITVRDSTDPSGCDREIPLLAGLDVLGSLAPHRGAAESLGFSAGHEDFEDLLRLVVAEELAFDSVALGLLALGVGDAGRQGERNHGEPYGQQLESANRECLRNHLLVSLPFLVDGGILPDPTWLRARRSLGTRL